MSKKNETGRKAATAAKSAASILKNREAREACERIAHRTGLSPRAVALDAVGMCRQFGSGGKMTGSAIVRNGVRKDTTLADIGKDGMRYADYSDETRAMIDKFAQANGITRDDVISRFEELYAGRGPGNGAKVFAATETKPVSFTDDGSAVTIRVTGKAYANLAKIAAAMNGVGWCDNDNTPATVCDFWIGSFLWRTQYAPEEGCGCNVRDVLDDIIGGIDTGFDDGTEEDAARKRELSAAFDAVKF